MDVLPAWLGDRDAHEALVLTATIGTQHVALPASRVERILPMAALTTLPDAPPEVVGVLNVHGDVLSVVDVRQRFGQPRPQLDPAQHLVLLRSDSKNPSRRALLWVDQAGTVLTLPASAFEPAPGGAADDAHTTLTPLLVRIEDRILPVLTPDALLPDAAPSAAGTTRSDREHVRTDHAAGHTPPGRDA